MVKLLRAVASRPGQWARIATYDGETSAYKVAQRLREAELPPGEWEFVARRAERGSVLYARVVDPDRPFISVGPFVEQGDAEQMPAADAWVASAVIRALLPTVPPALRGWSLCAVHEPPGHVPVSATLHDWFQIADGAVAAIVGRTLAPDLPTAAAAGLALRNVLRGATLHAEPSACLPAALETVVDGDVHAAASVIVLREADLVATVTTSEAAPAWVVGSRNERLHLEPGQTTVPLEPGDILVMAAGWVALADDVAPWPGDRDLSGYLAGPSVDVPFGERMLRASDAMRMAWPEVADHVLVAARAEPSI